MRSFTVILDLPVLECFAEGAVCARQPASQTFLFHLLCSQDSQWKEQLQASPTADVFVSFLVILA